MKGPKTMETTTREQRAATGEIQRSLIEPRDLRVRSIMTRDVVTAAWDDTIASAAHQMTQGRVSCVVVVDGRQVRGIFTERDIVRGLRECGGALNRMKVSERMSSPVEVVPAHLPVLEASRIMEAKSIKRLPVVADQRLAGIVTQTDITRALILLSPLRSVRDIMSRDVATIKAEGTVADATRILAERDISCIVALEEGRAVGIVTEKDLAKSVVAACRNPAEVRIRDVMSAPILGIPTTCCVHHANQKMSAMRLHRLVVTDGDRIAGIVTQSDITRAVRAEFEHVEAERRTVMAAIAGRVRNAMKELKQLQGLVRQSSTSASGPDRAGSRSGGSDPGWEITARLEHVIDELAQL